MNDGPRTASRREIAGFLLAGSVAPLNSTMLSVALEPISETFGVDLGPLRQALVTSYLITSVVLQAPAGKLADRLGHRRVLRLGQVGFVLASLAAMVAPSLAVLAMARIAMAASGTLMLPAISALIRREVGEATRTKVFGYFGATMALSAAIGPPLGGLLTESFGFRSTFAANLLVLPTAAYLARAPLEAPRPLAGFRFDALGATLLGASLASLALVSAWPTAPRLPLLGGAAALFAAFLVVELRHADPVVDLRLFRSRGFVAGGSITALHNLAMYPLLFAVPKLLRASTGATAREAGGLLSGMLLSMVVASPLSGSLATRFGHRIVATSGSLLGCTGIGILLAADATSRAALMSGLVVFGLGLGLAASPAQAASMNAAPPEVAGSAGSVLGLLRYVGGVLGLVILGMVEAASGSATVDGFHMALRIFGIAVGITVLSGAVLPRGR